MNPELLVRNLAAFSLQTAAVGAIGIALPSSFQIRSPRLLLRYWQGLLLLLLLFPLAQYITVPAETAAHSGLLFGAASNGIGSSSGGSWIASWIVGMLAFGTLLRLGYLAAGLWRLSQYRRNAEPIPAQPGVALACGIEGPVSFGVLRPVILLPASWRDLAPERQHLAILHERAHLRRNDWLFHLLEELVRAVLWFHPVFSLVTGRIRLTREQVVDREVIRETGSPDPYIDALLASATENGGGFSQRLPAPCFAKEHELVERIRTLKKDYSMSKLRAAVSFTGVALVLLLGGRAAIWSFPLQAAQSGSSGKVYRIADGVTAPRVLGKVDPEYTPDAKDAKIEGTVLLALEITPEGLPQNVQVKRSLEPGLDRNAVAAVYKWRFAPGTKDGELVTVAANIEVNFRLK